MNIKTCEIMQYFEYMPADCQTVEQVVERIKTLSQLKTYCIIEHNKDIMPNGELKPRHFHCVLTFTNNQTLKSIADILGIEPQYISKIKTTTLSAQLYLIHRNNPEKYQYSPSDVIANFNYINKVDDCPPKVNRNLIAEKIASGEIKEYNLFKYISIDEFAKNETYYNRCFKFRAMKIKSNRRFLQCIYMCGSSGSGKTHFAKELGKCFGYEVYVSSSGKNPLDDYKGEECIILDDTRANKWDLTDLLKLLDNNTDSLVGCRYYNKSISECKLIILTACKELYDFYNDCQKANKEPILQLQRRFGYMYKLTYEKISCYRFDKALKKHIWQKTFDNDYSINEDTNINLSLIDEMEKKLSLQECSNAVEEDINITLPF